MNTKFLQMSDGIYFYGNCYFFSSKTFVESFRFPETPQAPQQAHHSSKNKQISHKFSKLLHTLLDPD